MGCPFKTGTFLLVFGFLVIWEASASETSDSEDTLRFELDAKRLGGMDMGGRHRRRKMEDVKFE